MGSTVPAVGLTRVQRTALSTSLAPPPPSRASALKPCLPGERSLLASGSAREADYGGVRVVERYPASASSHFAIQVAEGAVLFHAGSVVPTLSTTAEPSPDPAVPRPASSATAAPDASVSSRRSPPTRAWSGRQATPTRLVKLRRTVEIGATATWHRSNFRSGFRIVRPCRRASLNRGDSLT